MLHTQISTEHCTAKGSQEILFYIIWSIKNYDSVDSTAALFKEF